MKKIIAMLLVMVLALSLLTACGGKSASDLDTIKKNGKIVVGITDYAPMDYKDENGTCPGVFVIFCPFKAFGIAIYLPQAFSWAFNKDIAI